MDDDNQIIMNDLQTKSVINDMGQIYFIGHIDGDVAARIGPALMQLASLWDPTAYANIAINWVNKVFHKKKNIMMEPIRIMSPYDITLEDRPLIDCYINGYGTDLSVYNQIATAISLARSRGVIVRTTVVGSASGIAGLLALMGTPGFRVMYENTEHNMFVPNYKDCNGTLGFKQKSVGGGNGDFINNLPKLAVNAYTNHTRLTAQEINTVINNRKGCMTAQFCINHAVCDWILKTNGRVVLANGFDPANHR